MEDYNEMTTQNTETTPVTPEEQVTETVTEQTTEVQAEAPVIEQTAEVQAEAPAFEQTAEVQAEAPAFEQTAEVQSEAPTFEQTAEVQPEAPTAPQPQMQNPGYAGPFPGWQPAGPDQFRGYNQGTPVYGYRDTVYGNYYGPATPPMQGTMPPYMAPAPAPEPKKEKRSLRKEHPVTFKIVDALIFGVVAALAFIGCNYLYSYFFPKEAEEYNVVQIATESKAEKTDPVKTVETIETVISSTPDVSAVVEQVAPAIVQIDCMFNTTSYFGSYQTPGAGSGIVMRKTDKELLIATNNHVVEGAASIKITFTDGTTADAVIKGTDSVADLAVVSVDLSTLDKEFVDSVTVAKLGSSDDIKVGQMAIAIGNAMGYGQSTTVGYISAKDREVTVDGTKMILIQTDAAINPGNSGGALINISGEVIGINSVKFASTQIEGMGFAIPISRAEKILDELGNRESLTHEEKGYLGVHIQTVTSSIAQAYNWPVGVYIAEVDEGLAADKAGIEIGDIITRVNSVTVTTSTDLKTAISSYRAGTKITVTVQRIVDNKFEEMDIEFVLGNEPDEDEPEQPAKPADPGEAAPEEGTPEEPDEDAPKASPKDGLPQQNPQTGDYGTEEIPDYFDPFKDFEDLMPYFNW